MASQSIAPIARPNVGRKGRPVRVIANHFPVELDPSISAYQYTVQFYPTQRPLSAEEMNEGGASKSPEAFNRLVLSSFTKAHATTLNNAQFAYDGRRNLYSRESLPFTDPRTFEFVIEDENGKKEDMTLIIQIVAEKLVGDLIQSTQKEGENIASDVLQALDVILRENLLSGHVVAGKSLFSSAESSPLGEGCSVWRGFYQSLRPSGAKFTLNVDLKFSAFYDEQNLIQFSRSVMRFPENKPFPRKLQDRDRRTILKELKGVPTNTFHTGRKMKHTVHDISMMGANEIFFENTKTGKNMNVVEYLQEAYGIKLDYPNLQCAKVNKRRDVFVPLELLFIPSHRKRKALTPAQTQSIVRLAAVKPPVRLRSIHDIMRRSGLSRDPLVKEFGVQVGAKPVEIKARVLDAPSVLFGGNSRVTPRDGSWNMQRERLMQPGAPLRYWGVIVFCDQRMLNDSAVDGFIGKLVRAGRENGMIIDNPRPLITRARKDARSEMTNMFRNINKEGKAQLIVCIKPNQDSGLYREIKQMSDCELGVPSQCLLANNVNKGNIQYCSNVTLKMNAKLGGQNFFPEPMRDRDLNHPFESQPFMMVGADVTHPGPGVESAPSIAAMVGSLDRRVTKFGNTMRCQGGRKEIIEDMQAMFLELIEEFRKANKGAVPKRIIMYRDGVSEGEFQQVLDYELWEMRRACMSISQNYRPPMTFVTVQKRHNSRFFPVDPKDGDRSGNCRAGTVVDTDIVHPKHFDFFLNSHGGLQGTSKSGFYKVLYDENGFNADQIQSLTYRMCHSYARCCKSVGVVSQAYYAHLLAFRGRCFQSEFGSDTASQGSGPGAPVFLKPERVGIHSALSSTLYYL
eukprot:CAMPEP_0184754634 /NCGR_PEP_ID=MMETSP0315-20130426/44719_1 /TAXON_ID=101924 /ORGANISM="Rhodosorus marinus, Strain UTEX LB 2760" /LENGTH=850 /DNA_ID=CAMNT_0027234059 /DNA_START=67 /DNA_END=2619 /DNA_ORIENTATION=+